MSGQGLFDFETASQVLRKFRRVGDESSEIDNLLDARARRGAGEVVSTEQVESENDAWVSRADGNMLCTR